MKISYNPKSSLTAITTETAANDDIIFDLYASKLWAKGVRIGADWADISSKPSSLKNPYALTISLNGTSQGPYDGSADKSINITPGSIGAATSGHNHDDRYYTKAESNAKYITDITTSVNKLTFTKNGSNINKDITVNVVYSLKNLTNIPDKDATTKASSGLYIYNSYSYTIGTNSYSSVLSINTGGTIQIAGNWGDDLARNLYWRSLSDRAVTSYPWKSWRTILDNENYSSTLDSRYYTESEIDSLLDAKLNRQNLSYGTWNPRGYNLAADYHYNGGDLSISESEGKIHVSVDGYFWLNEGQYRVLDTSDVAELKSNLTVHLFLSNTDTTWYPLIWGGGDHTNTSDSTGAVYKSYDKLSWQTSSLTLYATHLKTTDLNTLTALFHPDHDSTLKIYSGKITDGKSDGNICLLTSIDGTDGLSHAYPTQYGARCNLVLQPRGGQVYIGTNPDGGNTDYKLYVNGGVYASSRLDVRGDAEITGSIRDLAIGGGIYWNPAVESAGDGSDAASITLVRAGVAGGTTLVLSLLNDANDTILFKTNNAARLYHNNNFILTSKDTKVTSGKGYIDNTEITQVDNSDKVDNRHAISTTPNTGIIYKAAIYTSSSLTSYWVRLASIPSINLNEEFIATIHVLSGHSNPGRSAILLVYLRGRASSFMSKSFKICCNSNYDPNRFRLYYKDSDKTSEIWYQTTGLWDGIITTVISLSSEGSLYEGLTLYSGSITAVQTPSMSTYLSALVSTITDNISGNATSATKLQTARNLWGNSFDGTKDINGSIVFPNIGDNAISSKISWSGSTDGADIYYLTTGSDLGNLVLNVKDDTNAYILLALNGVFKSHFDVANSYWTGRSAQADKWTTARTFTIGNTAKNVDGSGNVSWSLSEIGVRDTWRTVQVNGTSIDNNTLNLCGSTYIGLTNVNGKVTFSLVGSSTTANQAILSNGTANGWTLKTLNIANWDTAYNLRHSHANKSVLDGITSGLVTNWNTAYTFVSTITGEDTDNIINKWDEIVNFLEGITEDNKLNTLLNSKLSILLLSAKDILTTKTNNALFWVNTIGTAGSITTGPFTDHPYALLSVTNFSQNDTNGKFFYRSRLAFSSAGDIKVASCHHQGEYKLDEAWYNVLTSKNSGINGSTIKLNGTSITVYSSGTADGRYVKKSGDTMTGALNFANYIWNNVGDDVAIGDHNIAGCLGIKGLNASPGLAFYNSSNTLLSKLIGTSNLFLRISGNNTYNILDTSTTLVSDGKGIINGTTITLVDNADTVDGEHASNFSYTHQTSFDFNKSKSGRIVTFDQSDTAYSWINGFASTHSNYLTSVIFNTHRTSNWYVGYIEGDTSTGKTNGLLAVHKLAFVDLIPTSLKNPHSLTLKANGAVLATYDGSSAKEANFTYANVGAASANHNHDNKYVRRWEGVYGSANKFLKLTINDEKGWIRLEVSDSNNALTGGYGIYMIGWGWHGNNNTDNLNVSCLYANDSRYTTALKVVRTSRNNYDFYFLFASGSSYPSYTINYNNVDHIDCTVTAVTTIPTATWTSSLAALQLNASQVNWSGITNKPSEFNPAAHTHTVFKNNLMIKGTNGISDGASIHLGIGDSDTGFKWISDGKCLIYANNSAVGEWTSGGMNWFKNPTVNGNKVWNAGNDGPDSGLDADTVDGYHATSGRTFNGSINWSENWNDAWSDGTYTHPWYGFDHRLGNRGVYSTTLSDYFGLTLKTGSGNISMTNNGNVGIGLFDPIYKLLVAGNVYASDKITSAGFKHSGVTENADLYVLTADGGYTFLNLTSNELAHEFDVDITVTSEWLDIEDFYGGNLNFLTLPGTYIVLVYYTTNSANSMYEGYFSGIMSWYTGTTNSNNADEIVLHRVGHAYANTIYLRTRESLRDDPHPYTKLQISANSDLKQHTYKFKFKRIC